MTVISRDKMTEKKRLDIYLTENGFAQSRERAKSLIMAGVVYIDNQKADKPGMNVPPCANVEVRSNDNPYVSRGGLKLAKAVKQFGLSFKDKVCMDIGASTGGFTDCMLQNGAKRVYCVDVGYGQLDYKLRNDERVINMERTNIRNVLPEDIGESLDFASVDVSFISLKLVLPVARSLLRDSGEMVCLIKPQFEAGREKVGKNGVVRDKSVHLEVIEKVSQFTLDIGFDIIDYSFSPIKGPQGNIEYLMYIKKTDAAASVLSGVQPAELVKASHSELD